MNGVFTSKMSLPPHNPLTLPANVETPKMLELWDYRTHAEGRPLRDYVDTLWAVKSVKRRPSPVSGPLGTVVLAQRDTSCGRVVYFHDLGMRQRFPGAHRVDALTLLPESLRWRKREIPIEDKIFWESQQNKWLEYWRAKYLDYRLPLAKRRRFDIRGRLRDWWQPRCGYQAVLASEMSIDHVGYHNWAMSDYSYLREALVVGGGDAHFRHAFDWWEEPLLYAKVWQPMQAQAGLTDVWQRVWYLSHDKDMPEFPQHLDGVDTPRSPDECVNHMTLSPGLDSEPWPGDLNLLSPQARASGPRRREIEWLKKHKPAN